MDYSELYFAVSNNDERRINQLVDAIMPVLISYLRATMQAELADAKDCAQVALIRTINKIKENKIHKPGRLYYYLLSACRNHYLRMSDEQLIEFSDKIETYYAIEPPRQIDMIIDSEKTEILKDCLEQLTDEHRNFIDYCLRFPEAEAKDIAAEFDITPNNVWTRKHRIIKMLNNCYMKKSNQ